MNIDDEQFQDYVCTGGAESETQQTRIRNKRQGQQQCLNFKDFNGNQDQLKMEKEGLRQEQTREIDQKQNKRFGNEITTQIPMSSQLIPQQYQQDQEHHQNLQNEEKNSQILQNQQGKEEDQQIIQRRIQHVEHKNEQDNFQAENIDESRDLDTKKLEYRDENQQNQTHQPSSIVNEDQNQDDEFGQFTQETHQQTQAQNNQQQPTLHVQNPSIHENQLQYQQSSSADDQSNTQQHNYDNKQDHHEPQSSTIKQEIPLSQSQPVPQILTLQHQLIAFINSLPDYSQITQKSFINSENT